MKKHSYSWFKNRIGKSVVRKHLNKPYLSDMIIEIKDLSHARSLFVYQTEFNFRYIEI